MLSPRGDTHRGADDLARDKGRPAARGLVVEQNPVAGEQPVGVAVDDRGPVRVELRAGVGGAGAEGGGLGLGALGGLPVELGGGGLVEPAVGGGEGGETEGLEETEAAEGVDVGGVLGEVEADFDVALGAEVVDLGGAEGGDEVEEGEGVGEVAVVEVETGVGVDVVDAGGGKGGGAAYKAMDGVAFLEEKLGEVGAILTRYPSNKGNPRFSTLFVHSL